MMKVITKFALVAAVAALAMAGTATESLAAKKKAAAPAACGAWTYRTASCTGNACSMQRCGLDGKWYPSLAWCWKPACPK